MHLGSRLRQGNTHQHDDLYTDNYSNRDSYRYTQPIVHAVEYTHQHSYEHAPTDGDRFVPRPLSGTGVIAGAPPGPGGANPHAGST